MIAVTMQTSAVLMFIREGFLDDKDVYPPEALLILED